MAYNNTVILTGNMGAEATIHKGENGDFASVSIATTDSYQDDSENWVQKESIWHNVLVFNPRLVELVKNLKTGTRVQITGGLSYREFPTHLEDGRTVFKKEATILAGKIELKPLAKKSN